MLQSRSRAPQFYGAALKVAREYRRLTKKELAAASACHHEQIARIETGAQPETLLREALVAALAFPWRFFHAPPPPTPDETILHFRKGASVSLKNRRQAVARGAVLVRLAHELERYVDLPSVRVPQGRACDANDIEACAEACRAEWGVRAHAPLTSIGRTAEQAGVVLGLLRDTDSRLQGYSFFEGGRPIVMLYAGMAPSRSRMTVAHELGHLVMHRDLPSSADGLEEQAYRFGGAFIVPRHSFLREFPRPGRYFDWRALVDFKQRWGLSVQASLKRAYDLGVLSPAQLRTGYIEVSRFKWRIDEPGETMAPESPHLLQDALLVCKGMGVSLADSRQGHPIPVDAIEELAGIDPGLDHDNAADPSNVVPLFPRP